MEDFRKYFNLPLTICETGYNMFVFDSENNRAFDILMGDNKDHLKIIKAVNGDEEHTIKGNLTHEGGEVFVDGNLLLMVRSWGRLTGTGGGLGLDPEKAADIQDEFCDYIIEQLTEK